MTLYSTTAATIRLGADRATIEHLATQLELGRGGNRTEARRNWLFSDAELDRMRVALAPADEFLSSSPTAHNERL